VVCGSLSAQTLNNASLSGRYFVREVLFTTDSSNNVTDAHSAIGLMVFSSTGTYMFTGQQLAPNGVGAALTVNGTYSVGPAGIVTMTNPVKTSLTLNVRLGAEALIGSSTEAADNTFDLFVGIPTPAGIGIGTNSLKGTYYGSDFEMPSNSAAQVRVATMALPMDGAGNIGTTTVLGHAANLSGGAIQTQALTGATYAISSDGSGTVTFPVSGGLVAANALLNPAQRILYLSNSGNMILGGTPGGMDLFVGVRGLTGSASNASLTGRSWLAGLRVDSTGSSASYVGSGSAVTVDSTMISSKRYHQSGGAAFNLTASLGYSIGANGTGILGSTNIALGQKGVIAGADVSQQLDPTGYEIQVGVPVTSVSGTGVFIDPGGIVNAASGAPVGDAISPGEYIAVYGSGLAAQTMVATPPYPPSLGGVSVSIAGLPAPIYFVSSGQINCLVPYGVDTTKSTVTVTVTNGTVVSNAVTVPLSKTSPGIFSSTTRGSGDGAILHLDGTSVTPASPARKGEIVTVYLTGLGALTKTIPDGTAPNPPAADNAVAPVTVWVGGISAGTPLYAGINPVYPGLYQINFTVPTGLKVSGELPIAIQTPDAFHDQLNLSVQ
jgi:uncharacterized protein (TIGR03437 family)